MIAARSRRSAFWSDPSECIDTGDAEGPEDLNVADQAPDGVPLALEAAVQERVSKSPRRCFMLHGGPISVTQS